MYGIKLVPEFLRWLVEYFSTKYLFLNTTGELIVFPFFP